MANLVNLDPLRNIDFTALDFDSLQEELIDYIRTNYASLGIQDDFLDSSAGRVFIDLLAYFGNILALRIDTQGREAYLPSAQRVQNVIELLNLVGEAVTPPKSASVLMEVSPNPITGSPITIPAKFSIASTGVDGEAATFEVYNNEGDYYTPVIIPGNSNLYNVTAWEGQFRQDVFISTGKARQSYKLSYSPVIADSVRVSVNPKAVEVITNTDIATSRCTMVDSLVYPYADVIIYRPSWDADNVVTVDFATELFGMIPPQGQYIYIDYRVGGGARGNIGVGTINSTYNTTDDTGNQVTLYFTNQVNTGIGGADQEDIDIAKERAPQRVRTAYKLVTREDYYTLLKDEFSEIADLSVVDRNTEPTIVPPNSVFVWIAPTDGGQVNDDLRQKVSSFMDSRRLVDINHYIFDAVYNDFTIDADITYASTEDRDSVELEIRTALLNEFGPSNLKFNQVVRYSQIIRIIQNIVGVEYLSLNTPTTDVPSNYYTVNRLLDSNLILTMTRGA